MKTGRWGLAKVFCVSGLSPPRYHHEPPPTYISPLPASPFTISSRLFVPPSPLGSSADCARSPPRPVGSTMAATHGNVIVCNNAEAFKQQREAAAAEGKVIVIDFTASWCGPCKFMSPFFAELSEKYPNLVFLKVDVDEVPTVSEAFEIRAMPTFLFIDENGAEVQRLVGANKIELEKHARFFSEKSAVAV